MIAPTTWGAADVLVTAFAPAAFLIELATNRVDVLLTAGVCAAGSRIQWLGALGGCVPPL